MQSGQCVGGQPECDAAACAAVARAVQAAACAAVARAVQAAACAAVPAQCKLRHVQRWPGQCKLWHVQRWPAQVCAGCQSEVLQSGRGAGHCAVPQAVGSLNTCCRCAGEQIVLHVMHAACRPNTALGWCAVRNAGACAGSLAKTLVEPYICFAACSRLAPRPSFWSQHPCSPLAGSLRQRSFGELNRFTGAYNYLLASRAALCDTNSRHLCCSANDP
jgi:hypothetical protein